MTDKKNKWSKNKLDRSNDLASRMMASKDFDGDWNKAFALSRWMENKGYEVKKKSGKPHKEYVPKNKAAGLENRLVVVANYFENSGMFKFASCIDNILNQVKFARKDFSKEEAKDVYKDMGFDKEDVDFQEFWDGINVELEHGKKYPSTNITDDDPDMTAQIAKAHIDEIPDYYSYLLDMEQEAEKEHSKKDKKSSTQSRIIRLAKKIKEFDGYKKKKYPGTNTEAYVMDDDMPIDL